MNNYSQKVLCTGEKLCKFSKYGFRFGLPTIIVVLIALAIGHLAFGGLDTLPSAFVFDKRLALAGLNSLAVIIIYLATLWVLVSIPLHFIGIHFLGLGQAALNTDLILEKLNKDKCD